MIVTVDTNVLASGVVGVVAASDRPPARLLRMWQEGAFTLAVSMHILDELDRTLARPYFRARVTSEQVRAFLTLLRTRARIVFTTVVVSGVATHPEDDLVLATAVSAGADYLVTGDGGLRALGAYGDVSIVSPRQFVDKLTAQEPSDGLPVGQ